MKFSVNVEYQNKFCEYSLPSVSNVEMHLGLSEIDCPYSIKLSAFDGQWKIKRNKNSTIYYNNPAQRSAQRIDEKVLMPSDIFKVFFPDESFAVIMIIELTENNLSFKKYDIKDMNRITVGKDDMSVISVKYKFISNEHIEIIKNGKSCNINVLKNSNPVFINGNFLNGTATLSSGDVINTVDFKIIFLGDILAVNMKNNIKTVLSEIDVSSYEYISRNKKLLPAFSRAPRDIEPLYCEPVLIEPAPNAQRTNEKPFIFTLGPAMTMPLPMISSMLIRYSLNSSASSNISMYIGMIASIGLSAVIGCVWAVANQNYVRKNIEQQENNRVQRYKNYVLEKENFIAEKQKFNLDIMEKQYLSSEELILCISSDRTRIWNRNKNHDDFLKIRLGTGICKFSADIKIPQDRFTLTDDMLSEGPKKLLEQYEYVKDVPKLLDLKKDKIIGLIGENDRIHRCCMNIIIQIASLYCYSDVRMAAFFRENEEKYYGWTKWLPHFMSEDGTFRLAAENKESSQNILYSLTHILSEREELLKSASTTENVTFQPHYIVLCTDEEFFNGEIIEKYITSQKNLGFTFICVYGDITKLYNQCISIVECCERYNGMYFLNEAKNIENQINFDKMVSYEQADRFSRIMSNMYVKEYKSAQMPSFIEYFEMLGIEKIQDYDLIRAYKLHHVYENIKSFVGIGSGNKPMYIDICEKKYGPHGLIAGTTGSGKSETIQTFIISLALSYHPDELAFVLIDYKGGGMANIFKGIPHLAGTITNIDGDSDVPDANQMRRTLISIESEYKRRLEIFSQYGINHIDNYIRLYHDGKVSEPMPHLVIISDEFAELVTQQHDFIDKLVSISRVGRSVGIHLILATQKPSGVVSPEIRTNSRFKICLKVQDKFDSVEILGNGKTEGASLKNKGQAYLQVGNDEIFEMFQTGYSGAKYCPENGKSDSLKKEVRMINLDGTDAVIKKINAKTNKKVKCSIKAGYAVNCCVNTDNAMIANTGRYSVMVSRTKDGKNPINIEPQKSEIIRDIGDCTGNEGNIYIFSKHDSEVVIEFINNDDSQLAVSVKYIINECLKNNIKWTKSLWLPALPARITLDELRKKYKFKKSDNEIIAETGIIDYPEKQKQYPAIINLSECTNLMIVGISGCGKTTFLKTMLFSLVQNYTSDEVVFYVMDFSSRIFKSFMELPHCGGVVFEEDEDMIIRLLEMIDNIIAERQKLFGQENTGTFKEYIKKHKLPLIILVIDNYSVFAEHFPKKFENMVKLFSNCVRYGVQIIITANSQKDITSKIIRNINNFIALQLKERIEYRELYNKSVTFMPTAVKGRGMIDTGDKILEFQTAVVCSEDDENEYMRKVFDNIIKKTLGKHKTAAAIPYIPEDENYEEFFKKSFNENLMLPLGYDIDTLSFSYISLKDIYCYCITAVERKSIQLFIQNTIFAGEKMNADVYYINLINELSFETNAKVINKNTEQIYEFFNILIEEFKKRKKIKEDFEAANPSKPYFEHLSANTNKIFVVIDNFAEFCRIVYDSLNSDNPDYRKMSASFEAIFKNGKQRNIYFFAGFEHNDFISDMQSKTSFRTFISERTGINLGGCLDRQKIFNRFTIPVAQQQKSEKYYIGNVFKFAGEMRNVFIPHEKE